MKHIKLLNENFKLVDLGNHNWFGRKPTDEYSTAVKAHCMNIMREETFTDEKAFDRIDRLNEIYDKIVDGRGQEINAIMHNSNSRNMRPAFCAETIYNAIIQGRVEALMQRDWEMGGLLQSRDA